MRSLSFLVALVSGGCLLHLASQAALHQHYGPGFHRAWPLAFMGVGLLLAGASLGARVGLNNQGYLSFRRAARLTVLGGLTLGTTLTFLGFLAALTALL
jgi:hypothetical protein